MQTQNVVRPAIRSAFARGVRTPFTAGASGSPTLDMNFVQGFMEMLDSRIVFSRASTAGTRINSAGRIETVAANMPRFDYDHSTVTERNLFTESEFRNGFSDMAARSPNVTAAAMTGYAGAVAFPVSGVNEYAYKSIPIPVGQIASLGAVVEMNDDLGPPVVGVNASGVDVSLVLFGSAVSATKVTIVPLGERRYWLKAENVPVVVLSSAWGIVRYAGNSSRSLRATAYQLNTGATLNPYLATTISQRGNATPRGLLMEDVSTNLLLQSEDMTASPWVWTGGVRAIELGAGPFGSNAMRMTVVGSATTGVPVQPFVATATSCSITIYAKKGGADVAPKQFLLRNNTTALALGQCSWNPATGAVDAAPWTSEAVGDGWYRLRLSIATGITVGDNLSLYYGATGVVNPGFDLMLSMPMAESKPVPGLSHIPTVATAVSRAADSFRVDVGSWYNPLASTLVMDFGVGTIMSNVTSSTPPYYSTIFLGKAAYQDGLMGIAGVGNVGSPSGRFGATLYPVGGTGLVNRSLVPIATTHLGGKVAVAGTATAQQGAGRGVLDVAQTVALTTALSGADRLQANGQINGYLKSLKYFPRQFTPAELQLATA